MDTTFKTDIFGITSFPEGTLPFRYLGVPLTSRKLATSHYMSLVDKTVLRIRHWCSKLLSYAGRVQLIKSITNAMSSYWMISFPFPKKIIHAIDAIFRSFLWTGRDSIAKKSLIAWKQVCAPRCKGGLNIISLADWNKTCLAKLLWNLGRKKGCLWIKWIHMLYFKGNEVHNVQLTHNASCGS